MSLYQINNKLIGPANGFYVFEGSTPQGPYTLEITQYVGREVQITNINPNVVEITGGIIEENTGWYRLYPNKPGALVLSTGTGNITFKTYSTGGGTMTIPYNLYIGNTLIKSGEFEAPVFGATITITPD